LIVFSGGEKRIIIKEYTCFFLYLSLESRISCIRLMKSKIQLDSLDSIEKFSCLSVDTDERKKTNSISLKHYVGKEYVTEESWI